MAISSETFTILKNFSKINNSIVFQPGNELRTRNPMNSVFAIATLNQTISSAFSISDLKKFLNLYSNDKQSGVYIGMSFRGRDKNSDNIIGQMTDQPALILNNGKGETTYIVITEPDKRLYDTNFDFPESDGMIRFTLSPEHLKNIFACKRTMGLKDLTIQFDGFFINNRRKKRSKKKQNNKNQNASKIPHPYIQYNGSDAIFKIEDLKMMPLYYQVDICKKGLARFRSLDKRYNLLYYVSLENVG